MSLLIARRLLRDVEHERQRVSLNTFLREANKAWHGVKLDQPDWGDCSHSLALGAELREEGLLFHLILNAYWEPLEFELPTSATAASVAALDRHGPRFAARHRPVAGGTDGPGRASYRVGARSVGSIRDPRSPVHTPGGTPVRVGPEASMEVFERERARRISPDLELVSLGDEEATVQVVSQAVLGLWEVVNNLTRLRPTRRERYRVTIFGSARADPDHWVYEDVRDLAAALPRLGCDIVTGGGPG